MNFKISRLYILKLNYRQYCSNSSNKEIRVRFAPSPTGYLHLGGLRTALYNYFFAKSNNGKFILRIEDTDRARIVPGALLQIQKDLEWAGIKIDEGPGQGGAFWPYVQSKRLDIYGEHVHKLLENNQAYYCFCTDHRLDLLRKEALRAREVPKYDNKCRSIAKKEAKMRVVAGHPHCIRFKLTSGFQTFHDLIYGDISYDVTANEGDPVIIKSDRYPTYHFANVVDDHCMQITHVLRGVEWQISTTKHLMMYRAFGWDPPEYGHLPLLMNADGTKLSKRQGDIKIGYYRENGIFPEALVNFIVHSGGGFEKDSIRHEKPKCYTLEELTKQFDITRINSHSGRLMPERLLEFNTLELSRRLENPDEEQKLIKNVRTLVLKAHSKYTSLQINDEHIRHVLRWSKNRITKLSDLVTDEYKFIWTVPKINHVEDRYIQPIKVFIANLDNYDTMQKNDLNPFLKQFCDEQGLKFSNFMKILRMILSGFKEGPSVAEIMEILGKESTIKRLQSGVSK